MSFLMRRKHPGKAVGPARRPLAATPLVWDEVSPRSIPPPAPSPAGRAGRRDARSRADIGKLPQSLLR